MEKGFWEVFRIVYNYVFEWYKKEWNIIFAINKLMEVRKFLATFTS